MQESEFDKSKKYACAIYASISGWLALNNLTEIADFKRQLGELCNKLPLSDVDINVTFSEFGEFSEDGSDAEASLL